MFFYRLITLRVTSCTFFYRIVTLRVTSCMFIYRLITLRVTSCTFFYRIVTLRVTSYTFSTNVSHCGLLVVRFATVSKYIILHSYAGLPAFACPVPNGVRQVPNCRFTSCTFSANVSHCGLLVNTFFIRIMSHCGLLVVGFATASKYIILHS